jgi:uncharacterized membrane protein YeaQ/YmgE (transglycosylase-associated protein family)
MTSVPILGIIGKALGKVLGSTEADGKSQLLELFKGNGQKQREFEAEMERLDQERLEKVLEDRMSAREMQIQALKQDDIFSKRYVYYLASAIIGTTILLSLVPMFFVIPQGINESLVNRATDFFYTIGGVSVLGYFFGAGLQKTKVYGRER